MKLLSNIRIYTIFSLAIFFVSHVALANLKIATATFAGGCFWSAQHDLEKVNGVLKVISGYSGGHMKNPSYEDVLKGGSGHYESVKVTYNPEVISYQELLTAYWHDIDPTDANGQFCDKGKQYQSVIFYNTAEEKQEAESSKKEMIASGQFEQIETKILPASAFYPAEEYHQEYAAKNPAQYDAYRSGCGRDERLQEVWGDKK